MPNNEELRELLRQSSPVELEFNTPLEVVAFQFNVDVLDEMDNEVLVAMFRTCISILARRLCGENLPSREVRFHAVQDVMRLTTESLKHLKAETGESSGE
jgi:hypothetical protein